MYEPIRTKAVDPRIGVPRSDYPRSSRAEALDIQLAGHLAALLTVTDELGLDEAAAVVAAQVTRLRGTEPARAPRRGGRRPLPRPPPRCISVPTILPPPPCSSPRRHHGRDPRRRAHGRARRRARPRRRPLTAPVRGRGGSGPGAMPCGA
ncbi:SCO4983 family protein [Streptomyces sp. ZAF1911]|uniref:SCO4983 family protein n=1 Tax=Streptomyces sp. ZAF1911 TaxID=2944129 RepID=UPI0030B81A7E